MQHTLNGIQVEGLRSILNSGQIDFSPINILVGTNSSGKSSFLRLFPLLSQSVEARTRGPILWNGPYIDFESIENTLSSCLDIESDCLSLSFFSKVKNNRHGFYSKSEADSSTEIKSTISIAKGKKQFTSYTKEYSLNFDNDNIKFTFNESGELIDVSCERLVWQVNSNTADDVAKYSVSETDSLIPFFKTGRNYFYFESAKDEKDAAQVIKGSIRKYIEKLTNGKDDLRLTKICNQLSSTRGSDSEKLTKFRKIIDYARAKKVLDNWDVENIDFRFLTGLCNLLFALEYSERMNLYLSNAFQNVHYIAPLRASTERYYRYQHLNIDSLDHTGSNLAMFISALTLKWQKSLDKWTQSNFNFTIKVDYSGSNLALKIAYANNNNSYNNITDMGFGFSQILPILVSLWSVSSGYERIKNPHFTKQVIFAIEQPELHLHPKMQSDLANVFVSAISLAKDSDINLTLIIETHSEALIATLGDLIAKESTQPEDVSILVFEQDRIERNTVIKKAHFTKDGTLEDWPRGFFSY